MADVLTRITVKEDRIIPIAFGAAIEYKFTTRFTTSSDLVGSSKQIVVNVRQKGAPPILKAPIEILLIKPNNSQETGSAVGQQVALIKKDITLGHIKFTAKPSLVIKDDIGGGGGVLDPFPPFLPPPPDPIHLTRFKYLIKDDDPNGTWTIQIKNKGIQSENFEIEIQHPDLQLNLVESKVPFSLLNRLLNKINRLFDVRLKIDNDFTLDFSEKAKDMLALEKIIVPIGEITVPIPLPEEPLTGLSPGSFDVDFSLININLETLTLNVVPAGDAIAFSAHAIFETSGNEINVRGPNVNISKLEVKSDLEFRAADQPIYFEERNLAGEFIGSRNPISQPKPIIVPTIKSEKFLIFKTQDGINSGVSAAIKTFLQSSSSKKILKTVAEHFTDMILFLASGKSNQVFFDIQTSATEFTVRHYVRPSESVRLRHHLDFGIGPAIPVTVTDGTPLAATPTAPVADTAATPIEAASTLKVAPKSSDNRGRSFLGRIQNSINSLKLRFRNQAANPPKVNAPINPNFKRIEHIVVLTLENRSFDHMLGYLTTKKNRTDIDGLGAPVNHTNPVPGTNFSERVFKLTDGAIITEDPGHGVDQVEEQIANGDMSGFVSNYMRKSSVLNNPGSEKLVMGFYDDDVLDVYDFLAENYMVCNRWFSSHPGATYPNRFISVMGSAPSVRNFEIGGNEAGAVKGDTIFDILTKNNVSWNYVESNIAFLRMFDKYRVDEKNIIQRDQWLEMARNGQLPAVSWVDPHIINLEKKGEADDDHPPANVSKGQLGVKEIYEALRSNDLHWKKTMFIITYDEHGGFYDHVPPHGINGEINPVVHKINEEGANHYGVRVPAFVISPWVKPRSVSNTIFDHTSILKTILQNFIGNDATNKELLGKRTDAANSLLGVLDDRPRANTPATIAVNQTTAAIETEPPGAINNDKVNSNSFHDTMLLFGFGSKFRKIVAEEIKKREE